jgi:signal transduction histidine kinase
MDQPRVVLATILIKYRLCHVRRKGGHDCRVPGPKRLVDLLLAVFMLVGPCASPSQSVLPLQRALEEVAASDHCSEARTRDLDYNVDATPAVVTFTVVAPVWRQPWVLALTAVILGAVGFQTGRVVRRGHRLVHRNQGVTRQIDELERMEAAREKLDAQLQQMQYLHRLRQALRDTRSTVDAVTCAGRFAAEALGTVCRCGISMELNGEQWEFGQAACSVVHRYSRELSWRGRARGRIELCAGLELSEYQERVLLDETADQLVRVLEALELEMQLMQSARLVSLGEMAAGVAHELIQPLGAISTTAGDVYLRLLEKIPMPEDELKEMMQDVVRMTERLGRTVEQLRVFSRDTSNEEAVEVSLNDVIENALQLMAAQLGNHGIHVRLDLADNRPSLIGHPHQLEQVMLNLLANARDALVERGDGNQAGTTAWKRIAIRTRYDRIPTPQVVLEVEDNGVGIDPTVQHRLFEPFFTTKTADRGTGLGLSISHSMVRNHGGEIQVESRVGSGTLFRVAIPASREG